ncbi:MAG: protein-disulfide reductase DsbD family protein [Siphonobacter sp.]
MKKSGFGILLLILFTVEGALAQEYTQINWAYQLSKTALQPGEEAELIVTASVKKGWLLYGSDFKADIGPQPTTFEFVPNGTFSPVGPIVAVSPQSKRDKTWDIDVTYFTRQAEFRQTIRIDRLDYFFTGYITGQVCHETKGLCVPFRQAFHFDPLQTK